MSQPPPELPQPPYPFAPRRPQTPTGEEQPTPPPPPVQQRGSGTGVPRFPLVESQDRIPVASVPSAAGGRADSADEEMPAPQRHIGPYAVYHEIARGGMGAVYYAEDSALRRRVAIKVMAKELVADADAVGRFQREARASASIDHPNVARVYLVGLDDDGAPFLAMEFVEGFSLDRHIRERIRMPWSAICDLMIQSAEGLRAAARQGIVHRDIKPANLMIGPDWKVKIVDFGLAKAIREESFKTVAGMVMGTPRYMSPEQAQGREADWRSDVYSLGAAFYHLATGRAPFDGDNPTQIMMKHITSPLVPMRSLNPDVPMEFDDIVRKCMSKDPMERWPDYMDLISALSQLKLQCVARERGSIVQSINDLPTIRQQPDGSTAPPAGARAAALPSASPVAADSAPMWRWVLAGVGALAVAFAAMALLSGGEKEEPPPAPAPRQAGLRILLERLMREEKAADPGAEIDRDLLKYRATERILEELGRALVVYQSDSRGEKAPSLPHLAESLATVAEFDTDAEGHPLDGWGNYLSYSRADQTIASPGLDGRAGTADDLVVDSDGVIAIQDDSQYRRLEEKRRSASDGDGR